MKLLLTGSVKYNDTQLATLKTQGFDITFVQDEREKLEIDCSSFDAVVCNSLFHYNDPQQFTNLKAVQLTSAGYDRIPVSYFAKKGIAIFNAKGVYSIPMAEWAVLKTLEIYKNSLFFYKNSEKKLWQKNRELYELYNKNVLIVGTGSVGIECAKRFKAFGAKILGADIFHSKSQYIDEFFYMDSFSQALKISDVVVVCLPFNDKTFHILNRETLSLMKDKAVLVNISRGKIINEDDLLSLVHEGKFLGVALDVFEQEPLEKSSPLWNCENVIITPHNSFVSEATSSRLFELILKNLTEFNYGKST